MPRGHGPLPRSSLLDSWERGGLQNGSSEAMPSTSGREAEVQERSGFPRHTGKDYRPLPELSEAQLHDLQRFKDQIGRELRHLRAEQLKNGVREYYTMEHYQRLLQFEARHPYTGGKSAEYCKDAHGAGCKECKTCHFCRQKTTDVKTWCPCSQSARVPFGGRGRGYWCGACLQIRMGQNIDEVHRMENWRCPCCLGICNCSGATCLRAKKGLHPTQQLIHEAERMHYMSVAHYLVLTHISEHARAMPMEDVSSAAWRKRPATESDTNPVHKRARMAYGMQQQEVQARILTSTARLAAQVALEFPPPLDSLDNPVQGHVALQIESWKALESAGNDVDDDEDDDFPGPVHSAQPQRAGPRPAALTSADVEMGSGAEDHAGTDGPPSQAACLANLSEALGLRRSRGQQLRPPLSAGMQGMEAPGAQARGGRVQPAGSADPADQLPSAAAQTFDGPHPGLDAEEDELESHAAHQRRHRHGGEALQGQHQARPFSAQLPRQQPPGPDHGGAAALDGAYPGLDQGMGGQHSRPGSALAQSAVTAFLNSATDTSLPGSFSAQSLRPHEQGANDATGSQMPSPGAQLGQPQAPAANADTPTGYPPAQPSSSQPAVGPDGQPGIPNTQNAPGSLQNHPMPGIDVAATSGMGGWSAALPPVPEFATHGPHSNGGVSRLLQEAQYSYRYPAGSEEHQECMKRIEMGLEDLKGDLLEAVFVSDFNRAGEGPARDPDQRLEHAPTDHASLKDAVAFLLIAADALAGTLDQADVIRLLFNQEPFVDFSRCDPRARAILLRAAFSLYSTMATRGLQVQPVVDGILGFIDCLACEYEDLDVRREGLQGQEVCLGAIKMDATVSLQQKEVTISTVMQGDAELLKIALQHVQSACTGLPDGSEGFLAPQLLSLLDGTRRVSGYVRYGVCHVLTTVLAAVEPKQRHMVAEEDLLMKQRAVATRLGGAMQLLDAVVSATYSMRQPRREASAFASEEPTMYQIEAIDQIKVGLLARIHGLLVEANIARWQDLEIAAIRPFARTTFWRQANTVYRHLAFSYIAVGLQSAPGGARRGFSSHDSGVVSLLRVWLQSALDEGRRHAIFAFFTHVLAANPDTGGLMAGLDAGHIRGAMENDRTGEARAAVVYHALSRLTWWGTGRESLLHGLDETVAALGRQIHDERRRRRWEASICSILLAICHAGAGIPFAGQQPGRVSSTCSNDRAPAITVILKMLALWMAKTASWRQQERKLAHTPEYGLPEATPTPQQVQEERQAVKLTCLRQLGDVLCLLAALAGSQPSSLEHYPLLLSCLRTALSVGLEIPSGSYLTAAQDAIKPGEGNAVDVALIELLAQALASSLVPGSLHVLHYLLGTHVHHLLVRAPQGGSQWERAGVNTLRLLGELFKQPLLRQSQVLLQLLLPPLMGPLLDALHPKQGIKVHLGVKEAVYAFYNGLVETNGELIVPPFVPSEHLWQAAASVVRPQQLWRSDLQTGRPITDERYQLALQLMLHSLCRGVVSSLAAVSAIAAAANQAAAGQEAEKSKDSLLKLLGQPRILSATERLYAEPAPADVSAGAPVGWFRAVDFKWVLAERALSFLAVLAKSGSSGPDWALSTISDAVHFLSLATSGLRARWVGVLEVLRAAGRDVRHFEVAQPSGPIPVPVVQSTAGPNGVNAGLGSLTLHERAGRALMSGVPQSSAASVSHAASTAPVAMQSRTTVPQPLVYGKLAKGAPFLSFSKMQRRDQLACLSGYILKKKMTEKTTMLQLELQEAPIVPDSGPVALVYCPCNSAQKFSAVFKLEAALNALPLHGVGRLISCTNLRYNGPVANSPSRHQFVASSSSTFQLHSAEAVPSSSGKKEQAVPDKRQAGAAFLVSQNYQPSQQSSLLATLPAPVPAAASQPYNVPSRQSNDCHTLREDVSGFLASQASSGGSARRANGIIRPGTSSATAALRYLSTLQEMGFKDQAANRRALKRVDMEGIIEEERRISRAVEILSSIS